MKKAKFGPSGDELIAASVERLASAIEEFPWVWAQMVQGGHPLSRDEHAKEISRQLSTDSFTKP